jgi:hypothetical protein
MSLNTVVKHFIVQAAGVNASRTFSFISGEGENKLECLSLVSYSSKAYPSETQFMCTSLGEAPGLNCKHQTSFKGLPGTNTLAYFANSSMTNKISFARLTADAEVSLSHFYI